MDHLSNRLSPEEIHKLAVAPLPTFNIFHPIMPIGSKRSDVSYSGGLFSRELEIEGYSFDRTNK